ncbi:acyltransferase family protein [Litorivicinus lipolyticus]|uniref:acyltransferase family protein n=1 Tax=Litorivicinus lipolyticus TaxID=418701 RepID=UPI003B5C35D8
MNRSLADFCHGRDNNFNLIRLIAAFLVLLTHSFALVAGTGDAEPLKSTLGLTLGTMAVDIFFVTSGFLITASFMARKNTWLFFWARILRIYPALLIALTFTVFGLGLAVTDLSAAAYLTEPATYQYLARNAVLFFGIEHQLPGVFTTTPYANAVNGSLWTLPYEVRMYVVIVTILMVSKNIQQRVPTLGSRFWVTLTALGSWGVIWGMLYLGHEPSKGLRLFCWFVVGAAFYLWRSNIRLNHTLALGTAAALIIAALLGRFELGYFITLPYLVFSLAYLPRGPWLNFNRLGDYSYGLYIYAFPVQQTLMVLNPDTTVTQSIALATLISLSLAILSWRWVEQPALRLKSHPWAIAAFETTSPSRI